MKFKRLAGYFKKIEKEPSRLAMTRDLAALFKEVEEEEIKKVVYLALGRLRPKYEGVEFNLAEKMMLRVISVAYEMELEKVKEVYKKMGDLGEAIKELRVKGLDKGLTVIEVYERLEKVAQDEGQGSQERKVNQMADLIKNLDELSARFVLRIPVKKLRLGFSDMTVLDGLSWMAKGDKSLREELERAYYVRADIGELAEVFKKRGLGALSDFTTKLGVPVMPALCQRLKTALEMIEKMGTVLVEPKFDGTRVQIHVKGKELLRTFTRNLDETTHMFPELKQAYKQIKAKSVILDSEAVGLDPKTKRLLTFQQTIVRKRKHQVEEMSKLVPLRFFVFDILYMNGKSLLKTPLKKRRQILERVIKGEGVLKITEKMVTSEADKLRQFHTEKLTDGLEGAVVKKIDDGYIPGRRGWSWVKFKEEEESAGALADTLDCVVMGYYQGKGRRTGFGIGAFLVGVRANEKILTVAKIGTGLTDEQWKEMKKRADKQKTDSQPKGYMVDKSLVPDAWVEPKIVVEIAADNITLSPNHSVKKALRFPRLVRFRDDKSVGQVTTKKELEKLFEMQAG